MAYTMEQANALLANITEAVADSCFATRRDGEWKSNGP